MTTVRRFLTISCSLIGALLTNAQEVGQPAVDVLNKLGRPMMKRQTASGEIWVYGDGTKFTVQDGVVTQVFAAVGTDHDDASAGNVTVISVPHAEAPRVGQSAGTSRMAERDFDFPLSGGKLVLYLALAVASFVASIWFLVVAFRAHVGWGLACLLLPFAGLIFAITHWNESRKPFCVSVLTGIAAAVVLFSGGLGAMAAAAS